MSICVNVTARKVSELSVIVISLSLWDAHRFSSVPWKPYWY